MKEKECDKEEFRNIFFMKNNDPFEADIRFNWCDVHNVPFRNC